MDPLTDSPVLAFLLLGRAPPRQGRIRYLREPGSVERRFWTGRAVAKSGNEMAMSIATIAIRFFAIAVKPCTHQWFKLVGPAGFEPTTS